jgi:hypothetical protein
VLVALLLTRTSHIEVGSAEMPWCNLGLSMADVDLMSDQGGEAGMAVTRARADAHSYTGADGSISRY